MVSVVVGSIVEERVNLIALGLIVIAIFMQVLMLAAILFSLRVFWDMIGDREFDLPVAVGLFCLLGWGVGGTLIMWGVMLPALRTP